MSITDTNHKAQTHKQLSFQDISHLFTQLDAQSVEQFYQGYQFWSQQQHIKQLNAQMAVLQQQINENAEQMQQMQPSTLALVALAQLQASGVDDLDLLERMLDRGEEWLDHTMQLLELCQQLDVIQGNYTQWCEHALEGAYEWIESIHEASASVISPAEQNLEPSIEATEELLLQKLMSDGDNLLASQTATPVPPLLEDSFSIPEDITSPEANTPTLPEDITSPEANTPIPSDELATDLFPEANTPTTSQKLATDLFSEANTPIPSDELATDLFPEATEAMLLQKLMSDSSTETSQQLSSEADSEGTVYSASTWYDTYDETDLLADVTEEILFQKLMSDPDVTTPELRPKTRNTSSTWSEQDTMTHSIEATTTANSSDYEQDVYIPDNIEILDLSIATNMDTETPPVSEADQQPEQKELSTTSDAEKTQPPTTVAEDSDALFASFPINQPTNKIPELNGQSSESNTTQRSRVARRKKRKRKHRGTKE